MKRKTDLPIALIAGVAIGTAIGILLAPNKGSETRRKIKEGYDDAKNNLKDRISIAKQKFSEMDFEGSYDEVFSDIGDKSEEVISLLERKLQSLKDEAAKMKG